MVDMASLKEVGERALIQGIMSRIRSCDVGGPGDDAVVLDAKGKTVLATDIVTFARHMPKGMTYEEFGWMAAAVNFSDLASMGARPIGVLVALAMPSDMDEECVYHMMDGVDQCAEFCNTYVLGGDTKTGEGAICGTAVGDMEGRVPMTRYGAMSGDVVAVTGTLGSAAAGYYAIQYGVDEKEAIRSLKTPIPRIEEGIKLARIGATSCMDISDGLSTSISEICSKNMVGMDILWDALPRGPGVERMKEFVPEEKMMLDFGGEYELMFTFRKERLRLLYESKIDFTIIGTVNDGVGAYILKDNERIEVRNGGYEHFKDRS